MALLFAKNNSLSAVTALPASVSGGGLNLISSQTASSSTTISFTSGIDSTYDQYIFKFININAGTSDTRLELKGSTNTGSSYGITKTTTAFQVSHGEDDSYTAFAYVTSSDLAQSTSGQRILNQGMGNSADDNLSGEMFLFNPSSTSFVKHFIIRTIQNDKNPGANDSFIAGYFNTTSAIDAIQFKMNSGNIDSGSIKLYGIKDS